MNKKVRVRFAPSPTGGLHLGGVRTALFNYLFAKKHKGDFIIRIEDTDQTRFVDGAEEYIYDCLEWCGINPVESTKLGGPHIPYRQSERKHLYKKYAEQLVSKGYAYYAFDTAEELNALREKNPNFYYGHEFRNSLRNSLTLSDTEVANLLEKNTEYVIRIKAPKDETIAFNDQIRGFVSFDSNIVDDKVLLKADGMPTYHLAVVVDDYLMEISHVFRGEEWLPSSPVHILLWKYLGWEDKMPEWAHLPLILKPDGNGKLSKRDGERLGFPVFAMDWKTPNSNDTAKGFKELGFIPEAFVNFLAMLGWNDGTDKEIFSLKELENTFSLERINKAGAKFDFEKAKWFNAEWIKLTSPEKLLHLVKPIFAQNNVSANDAKITAAITLVKERCTLIPDFWTQASFLFTKPTSIDTDSIKPKWNDDKNNFFVNYAAYIEKLETWNASFLESEFKKQAADANIKIGELMLPLRIMLVGGKFGPDVFNIVEFIGQRETVDRIRIALKLLK